MKFLYALICVAAFAAFGALAAEPDEVLDDPALEARAVSIGEQLRCVVCQSQSIEDSNAPLAKDLRLLVRERLTLGDSDAAVFDYVVARYGEYVLLKPRFQTKTLFLWLFPAFALAFGGLSAWLFLRKKGPEPLAISAEEAAELRKLTEERD